jgi:hypothetical protein
MEVSDFEVERVMRWMASRRRRNENNELADQFWERGDFEDKWSHQLVMEALQSDA